MSHNFSAAAKGVKHQRNTRTDLKNTLSYDVIITLVFHHDFRFGKIGLGPHNQSWVDYLQIVIRY